MSADRIFSQISVNDQFVHGAVLVWLTESNCGNCDQSHEEVKNVFHVEIRLM
jgi:hypothetical protein